MQHSHLILSLRKILRQKVILRLHTPSCLIVGALYISDNKNNNNNNNKPFYDRWGEKRQASLRSSRNKLRPHTRVRPRPRPLARSPARFILSLFIAESCLPPFSPLFLRTSLGRNVSGMQTVQNQPMHRSDVGFLLLRKLMSVENIS